MASPAKELAAAAAASGESPGCCREREDQVAILKALYNSAFTQAEMKLSKPQVWARISREVKDYKSESAGVSFQIFAFRKKLKVNKNYGHPTAPE